MNKWTCEWIQNFQSENSSAFHRFFNSFGMKSKFLSLTYNSLYDLVSAYLPCFVCCLSWSHLPTSHVPCAPDSWKARSCPNAPHLSRFHTSMHCSLPQSWSPFSLVLQASLPAAWHMSCNSSFVCMLLSPSSLWIPWKLGGGHSFFSSMGTTVPNMGQRLKKHLTDEWMGSRRILWSFKLSPLPSALF